MKNSKLYLSIIIIVVLLGYLVVSNRITSKKLKYEFEKFNNANLNGLISQISIKQHRIAIQLVNDSSEYLFNPESVNYKKSFLDLAQPDDKIYKPSLSDTLFLLKKGNIYKFNFEKVETIMK